jgi:unsaturated rhamnogalacturonyl hydrolase
MAESVLRRYPGVPAHWHYQDGLVLKALEQVWLAGGDDRFLQHIKDTMDLFIDAGGDIRTYRKTEFNLDQINMGRNLFTLYRLTGEERYKQAIYLLRKQLREQPRTPEGGFWHKQIYPQQMWLDGIYMASPFYAEFGREFGEPEAFDDVARQIVLIEEKTRDPKTGLLYHAWDSSRQQPWANPQTGQSPHFWDRAIGWYVMAIVDVLDYVPQDHAARPQLIEILERTLEAVVQVQDAASGMWYQVLDKGDQAGNYLESSGSCMFVYAMAKGVRKGYLPAPWLAAARRGYQGILTQFITVDDDGLVNLGNICGTAGLGGTPYRDGSYEYYIKEALIPNDYKGVGAFIYAACEMEQT